MSERQADVEEDVENTIPPFSFEKQSPKLNSTL